jgi:redox-sensitive bicupin YhaK (pirin superfamily)
MITLRRADQRHHDGRGKRGAWRTFFPQDRTEPFADGFGILALFNEHRLPPSATVPYCPHHDAEIVTYVREGALAYEDSSGSWGVILAGEFQRMSTGCGSPRKETNASSTDWAQIFRISLRPPAIGLKPGHERKRFSAAERRGVLCVVASPDARGGSLRICQDALVFAAMLDPGHHVIHELLPGRSAWLHLVQGEVTLRDYILTTGDGAGVIGEAAVSLTARKGTELLLVDLGGRPPESRQSGRPS